MKKLLVLVIMVVGVSFVSCEKTNINDETGIQLQDVYSTDKEDSTNSGGSTLDPSNDD